MQMVYGINDDGYYVDENGNNIEGDNIRYSMQELYDMISNDDNGNNDSGIPEDIRSNMCGYITGIFQYVANFIVNKKTICSIGSDTIEIDADSFECGYHDIDQHLFNELNNSPTTTN